MSWISRCAAGAALLAGLAVPSPAHAQQDIGPTWNSDDHDAIARFQATGDVFVARGYTTDDYVDWTGPGSSSRWWLGSHGNQQSLNLDFSEGRSVSLNVCQEWAAWPDDCSGRKYGVS